MAGKFRIDMNGEVISTAHLYRSGEVAKHLGISAQKVQNYIASGKLKAYPQQDGNRTIYLITAEELERFEASQRGRQS